MAHFSRRMFHIVQFLIGPSLASFLFIFDGLFNHRYKIETNKREQ